MLAPMSIHSHNFNVGNPLAERRTRWVVALTATTMVVEIACGYLFNSMALLADGWHMSSHALALGLSAMAYALARRLAHDRRFTFGTWKIEILGGYTSAVLLLVVAGSMAVQSIARLLEPSPIRYEQAIAVAVAGLVVNLVCAALLQVGHGHDHGHAHHHDHDRHHDHAHQDLNLRAAYLHVITDAATSVLAIIALIGGLYWGARWLDPAMGIVGAILVTIWAVGLLRAAGAVLLDAEMDAPVVAEIRQAIASGPIPAEIADLHVWRVAQRKYACIIGLHTQARATPEDFRRQLAIHEELVHITVEINESPRA